MSTGLLRVRGTINLAQFWPTGSADADTTKILVDVAPGTFRFRPHPRAAWQVTNAFANAIVVGTGRKPAIDNQGKITVRLQGIDAPELHYRPSSHITDSQGRTPQQKARFLEVNEEYRQHSAETSAVKLAQFLARAGQDPLPCTVETAVDQPDEVFDTYGRFVGDIVVRIDGQDHNINQWLVRQGFAFPAFYNSMSAIEIGRLRANADQAWAAGRYVWPNLQDCAGRLDRELRYRRSSGNPTFVEANDVGPVIMPKLFRRLATWEINRYAGMVTSGFWSYLESRRDECYLTDEFLAEPTAAPIHSLNDYVDLDGCLLVWPEELVFRETRSRLIRPGGGQVNW